MEKVVIEEEELIFLTLLCIYSKEYREVIDSIDLENCRKIIDSNYLEHNYSVHWRNELADTQINKLEDSIVEFSYHDRKYYSIRPSVTVADLYNDYQKNFVNSSLNLYIDFNQLENIPKRGVKDQKLFNNITSLIVNDIVNNTDTLNIFSNGKIGERKRK